VVIISIVSQAFADDTLHFVGVQNIIPFAYEEQGEKKGKEYTFKVNGLSLVDLGVSNVSAAGEVYHLRHLSDFAGTYYAASAGIAVAAGAGASALESETLKIGIPDIEPHFFVNNEPKGVFISIIREAFKEMPQYELEFVKKGPNKRNHMEFKQGRVDAAANIFMEVPGCQSVSVFRWTDVAVTVTAKRLSINSIQDLANLRVSSFQGAKNFLGEEFKKMAESNPRYSESSREEVRIQRLINNRIDVAVSDVYILLNEFKKKFSAKLSIDTLTFKKIFTGYTSMAFQDEALCQQFSKAVETIKQNGKYDMIYESFLQDLKSGQ
jgi:ABC-type amino acid transport substrate-binding protein